MSGGAVRPRLGFLGVGWIGRQRMEAVVASGAAEVAAVADASPEALAAALAAAPGARPARSFEQLLEASLDGLVIATPSALHAGAAIAALRRGLAVFCQKPLGRNVDETAAVVRAAAAADRLLQVDLSYRFTEAARVVRGLVGSGELGDIFAVDLVFHNAYGPDKLWFHDRRLAGGGCVIDLGIHLVDLALWCLDFPRVDSVAGHVLAGGKPLPPDPAAVEDYAAAQLVLDSGAVVRLACSWRLPAGRDAVIEAAFYGTRGGARLANVDGSFYDLVAERLAGTHRETLAAPPDPWGGRAAVAFAQRLATDARFDPEAQRLVDVAEVLDRIYEGA